MTDKERRREERLKCLTVTQIGLHDEDNHAFHLSLSPRASWELLTKISHEAWYIQTGQKAPTRLDKNMVHIITKDMRVSDS